MARPEFPSTPIGAKVNAAPTPGEARKYAQPPLAGIELEPTPEIELGNCTVTGSVRFRKLARGNEWHCRIHAAPDLMHPEQEGEFEAHAYRDYADMAQQTHLRPGDRALMRGTLHQQTVTLGNGETRIIHHFSVTAIEVLARSKRTSITAYEKAQAK